MEQEIEIHELEEIERNLAEPNEDGLDTPAAVGLVGLSSSAGLMW